MSKKIALFFLVTMIWVAPFSVFAAEFGTPPAIQTNPIDSSYIGNLIGKILDVIWIAFIAFAIIMFIVAGFQFLAAQGEPEGVGKARKFVLWGIIGVAIAVAAFSIPFFIRNNMPTVPGSVPYGGNCSQSSDCESSNCVNGICSSS